MYEPVEKKQENKSQSLKNAESQRHNSHAPTYSFVDNRPEAIQMRRLRDLAKNSPRNAKLSELHNLAAAHSVTQKKSGVKPGVGFVDNRPEAVTQRKLIEMAGNYSAQPNSGVDKFTADMLKKNDTHYHRINNEAYLNEKPLQMVSINEGSNYETITEFWRSFGTNEESEKKRLKALFNDLREEEQSEAVKMFKDFEHYDSFEDFLTAVKSKFTDDPKQAALGDTDEGGLDGVEIPDNGSGIVAGSGHRSGGSHHYWVTTAGSRIYIGAFGNHAMANQWWATNGSRYPGYTFTQGTSQNRIR